MRSAPRGGVSYDLTDTVHPATAAAHPLLAGGTAAHRLFRDAVDDLLDDQALRYRRLWAYYENPMRLDPADSDSARPYRLAQEWGVPSRITGRRGGEEPFDDAPTGTARKEVVVENDIGWRIDTQVDFLFGRPLVLDSAAPDAARAEKISAILRSIFAAAGGLPFLQQIALLGGVYGSVDLLVKLDPQRTRDLLNNRPTNPIEGACDTTSLGAGAATEADAEGEPSPDLLASAVRLEIVEPPRALPILDPSDGTLVCAYAQAYRVPEPAPAEEARRDDWLRRLLPSVSQTTAAEKYATIVEVIGPRGWQRYRDASRIDGGPNPLGLVPLAHAQNTVRPFEYEGAGDVEPLIPLQDELNTRLSDRANRIALQSMKMYLGVGIDDFGSEPVQPGRMWSSINPDARVTEFGGDSNSPSEQAAISEVREALDKLSGVNPVASGAIRGRVGNLTSAAALRLTFQSLLARTERKRANYGAMVARACELSLAWLDVVGLFHTEPHERRVKLTWADPIPVDESGRLEQARLKQQIGVDPDLVRRELGY